MRLRVTWSRRDDLQRDLDAQLAKGGLFVTVPPEAGHALRLPLELVAPDGTRLMVEGEVLASVPEQGVAIAVNAEAVATLRAVLARGRADPPNAPAPRHERTDVVARAPVAEPAAPVAEPAAPVAEVPRAVLLADAVTNWDQLTPPEKMRLAQHGGRDERAAVLRDKNRALHPHVLKNARISIEEVVFIAKNPQMAADMLKLIADRSEWFGRSMVAEALARNPKTPAELAVRALQHCGQEALRQMAKGAGAPPHVVQAARKAVLKGG
jgi:hypothetical protein